MESFRARECEEKMHQIELDGAMKKSLKKSTEEALMKFYLKSEAEDELLELVERGIDSVEQLPEDLRERFEEELEGNLGREIVKDIWKPWWNQDPEIVIVTRETDFAREDSWLKQSVEILLKDIPKYERIYNKNAKDEILWLSITELITTYSFLLRYYNGDAENMREEFLTLLFELTRSLYEPGYYFTSADNVLEEFSRNLEVKLNFDRVSAERQLVCTRSDVSSIISYGDFPGEGSIRSLSHLHYLTDGASFSRSNKRVVFQMRKKIEYLLSWMGRLIHSFEPF